MLLVYSKEKFQAGVSMVTLIRGSEVASAHVFHRGASGWGYLEDRTSVVRTGMSSQSHFRLYLLCPVVLLAALIFLSVVFLLDR